MKKQLCLFSAIIIAVVIFFHISDFFIPYYNIDELTNSLFANFILDGKMILPDFLGNTYLLTHYFYAAVTSVFGRNTLFPIYFVNLIWILITAGVFFAAGKELSGKREGGFWAALFYIIVSICFVSKDYRAVISEGLSLLPLAVAAYFYFRAIRTKTPIFFFITGFFIGVAGLFKAPAAIMIFALWSSLFFLQKGPRLILFLYSGLGMIIAIFSPLLFVDSPIDGFNRMLGRVDLVQKYYIAAYENLPVLYWGFKYLIRTCIVAASCPLVWYLAFKTLRGELSFKKGGGIYRQRFLILFLFFWFLTNWFIVSIGKRVFYHYFIFLIPPLCLLAVPTMLEWSKKITQSAKKVRRKAVLLFLVALLIPPIGWTVEAICGWSPRRPDLSKVISYVHSTTKKGETIYVWGIAPQIYFFSERDPASTFFWAETLAGSSPGTPAMEYVRATGRSLTLPQSVFIDLQPSPKEKKTGESSILDERKFYDIQESELLSIREILEKIDHPLWKKVFEDFFKSPPVLFLDTSPTGIRGFAHFPLTKYELLEKFLEDNYVYETTVDNVNVYRLKRKDT